MVRMGCNSLEAGSRVPLRLNIDDGVSLGVP